MEKKGLVILNPNANKGKGKKLESIIYDAFKRENVLIEIIKSKGINDCRKIAYEAVGNYSFITAAGGDGTANEVADGIIKRSNELNLSIDEMPMFSILPTGRGNDFAWFLEINGKDINAIVKKIINNEYKAIDVGYCIGGRFLEGTHFINGLGIGFEPSVNFIASSYKKVSGTLSYVLALFQMLRHYPVAMDLEIETLSKKFTVKSQQLSIGNGRRMGSAFLMTPKAIIDDGFLDFVYAFKPIEKNKILKTAIKFLSGKQLDDPHFSFSREKWIKITSTKNNMPIHIDGEMVGKDVKTIEIYIKEKALKVIC